MLTAIAGPVTIRRSTSVVEKGEPTPSNLVTPNSSPPTAPVSSSPTSSASSAPVVTLEPSNQTVSAGTTVTFEAGASGTPAPSVQWRVSNDGGAVWSNVADATSPSYSFVASGSENGEEIDAVFSNSVGSATTNTATLTLTVDPFVTSQPQSQIVATGSTVSFSAAASGNPSPTVQWYESSDGGLAFTAISAATATTYSFTASTFENGYEVEATFTNSNRSVTTSPATLWVVASAAQSSNWSGYVDTGATFDAVSGTWTVSSLTCPTSASNYSATWVGIDGNTSSTVEQDGTEADCIDGAPSYDAWFEMYGDSSVNGGDEVELSPSTYPVSPGDVMVATVSFSAGTWTLSLNDRRSDGTAWSFSTHIAFAASQSSAEWIVESPEVCTTTCSLASLADFDSVTFSSASATVGNTSGTISSRSNTAIEMVDGSDVLALPDSLGTAGDSFTDSWEAS